MCGPIPGTWSWMAEPSARLELIDNDGARALAGGRSENLRLVEKRLGVHIGQRGNVFLISGDPDRVQLAERLLAQLNTLIEKKYPLGLEDVEQACKVGADLGPLYDAVDDLMGMDRASDLLERGTVEVAPLACMRGRTLNDSFVSLGEAQSTATEQMKMFLTRLGFGSKAVVTG